MAASIIPRAITSVTKLWSGTTSRQNRAHCANQYAASVANANDMAL